MKPLAVRLSMSTVYLMPCRGGYLQVDTGYEWDYPIYRRRLAGAGINLQSVQFLLLTHHHDDHSGFLNNLTRAAPVRIIAHRAAAELLSGGMNDKTHGGGYINQFIKFIAGLKMRLDPRWNLTFTPFMLRETDLILEGDDDRLLRELGIDGRLLYTPGHSIDHLSMILDSGEMFCGDAAASFLLWAGTNYCTVFMTDMVQAYQSWQKMLDAGARLVYPAHGHPFPANQLVRNMGRIQTRDLASFF